MNYIIVDTTANHDGIYIDNMGENTSLIENALSFETEKGAMNYIHFMGWHDWAKVIGA